MNLQDKIKNISADSRDTENMTEDQKYIYRLGHRDALHAAAAEISLKADPRIEELEEAARVALQDLEWAEKKQMGGIMLTSAEALRTALGQPTQYLIRKDHPYGDGTEYWSNKMGWVDRQDATLFSRDERDTLSLPAYGNWERA